MQRQSRRRPVLLGDGERDPLQRRARERAALELGAEARVAAQSRGRAREHAEEVRQLTTGRERAAQHRQRPVRGGQVVVDLEPAHRCLHRITAFALSRRFTFCLLLYLLLTTYIGKDTQRSDFASRFSPIFINSQRTLMRIDTGAAVAGSIGGPACCHRAAVNVDVGPSRAVWVPAEGALSSAQRALRRQLRRPQTQVAARHRRLGSCAEAGSGAPSRRRLAGEVRRTSRARPADRVDASGHVAVPPVRSARSR